MTEMERITKGLKYCSEGCSENCPYFEVDGCDQLLAREALELLKEQEAQRNYEASVEMVEYCERYEQTYNQEDGSM